VSLVMTVTLCEGRTGTVVLLAYTGCNVSVADAARQMSMALTMMGPYSARDRSMSDPRDLRWCSYVPGLLSASACLEREGDVIRDVLAAFRFLPAGRVGSLKVSRPLMRVSSSKVWASSDPT